MRVALAEINPRLGRACGSYNLNGVSCSCQRKLSAEAELTKPASAASAMPISAVFRALRSGAAAQVKTGIEGLINMIHGKAPVRSQYDGQS